MAKKQEDESPSNVAAMSFPNDATTDYPVQAMDWIGKYGITVEQCLQNNIYYSAARNQVIFRFNDGEGRVVAWQARNLSADTKAKRYYTQGDINELLPIYHTRDDLGYSDCGVPRRLARRLVLVEDCLSAIKVASCKGLQADAIPCLGSGIPLKKIARLRPFYDVLTVFLDGDMYAKALKLAQQAESLGFETRVVYSEKDPKEFTHDELRKLLTEN